MSERTLLDPALRGKAGFTEFYVQGMAESCAAAHAEFVWGGTAAVKAFARFGFDVDDCFFEVILVSSLEPIRALLTSRTSTAKQKLFYTFAYGRSLARRLVRRATGRRHVVRVETLHPGSAALDGFLRAFPAAHPDSLFMEYSPRKLAWLVTENPFRSRELLFLRSAGELSGLAIVEREPGGIATVADLLILPPDQIEAHCAAVADHLARQGIGAARLFGNAKNRYVASLRAAFSKLGAVPLPARAQLVIRGPGDAPERHPAVSELALTQIWSPPL